jgi:hypothetical protein
MLSPYFYYLPTHQPFTRLELLSMELGLSAVYDSFDIAGASRTLSPSFPYSLLAPLLGLGDKFAR